MLARTNKIIHPLGITLETPILVPSFSSKGFTFNGTTSEVAEALELSKEFITESILVSAYDIFHRHIPSEEDYLCAELTFIDSGGYETSDIYDLSATSKYSYPIKDWGMDKYESTLSRWPSYKASVIVSYDHGNERESLENQIQSAVELSTKYSSSMFDFLIKPETNTQNYIQMKSVLDQIGLLDNFSIIGVTEKELGNSVLARMVNLTKLRKALDGVGNTSPIHVFGSLDPLTSILYFISGAEIFDGLTWLKYSYHLGTAIYRSNYGALNSELGIHVKDAQVKIKSLVNNVYYLDKMKYLMKDFVATENFDLFEELGKGIGEYVKKCHATLQSNLK